MRLTILLLVYFYFILGLFDLDIVVENLYKEFKKNANIVEENKAKEKKFRNLIETLKYK
jgi:hypothetical protein